MKLPFGFEISKAKAAKPAERAVGMIGLKTSSGLVEEEFLQALRWPQVGKVYQEMSSNDAIVGGCLYLIETIIRKARWYVKPATTEPGDVEHARFVETCMNDMRVPWDDFVCEVLSMLTYGFSVHEITYKVRRGPLEKDPSLQSKHNDGKIGWQDMPIRSQASMREWVIDEATGIVQEMVQDPGQVGGNGAVVNIPIATNLLFRTKSSRGNPEGWSILRRAYRSWFFKKYIEELEGIGIERNLAGIPVLKPAEGVDLFNPDNPEMVEMLAWSQALVDGLRQDRNHGLVIPAGWELDLLGAKNGAGSGLNTDTIIRRHETRIAMAMLADIVVMGADRTGSFALGEVKQNIFISSLQTIITRICSELNSKAVPRLFAFNGIELEAYPQISATNLETPTTNEVALLLRAMQIDVSKNMELYNFLMETINGPTVTEEEFNTKVAAVQRGGAGASDGPQDETQNAAKQSDLSYT